jgi:hypothetical protein
VTASQLGLYNAALSLIGQRRIASLSVNEEGRRVLDDIWNNGAVNHCLEQGQWRHALRTVQIDYDSGYTATFGYAYRFDKPTDLIRLTELCEDEFFQTPLLQYQDEGVYWFAELQTIYVRYVSNGASYGLNYALWPETFNKYVAAYLAWEALPRIKDSTTDRQELERVMKTRLLDAKSKDALKDPTKYMPEGSWITARRGFNSDYNPYRRR